MKITKEILKEMGADDIDGQYASYSGIGWYLKECVLEWDDEFGVMYLSFTDGYYDVKTSVSEVEDLRIFYKMLSGEEIN